MFFKIHKMVDPKKKTVKKTTKDFIFAANTLYHLFPLQISSLHMEVHSIGGESKIFVDAFELQRR